MDVSSPGSSVSELLQSEALCAKISTVSKLFQLMKVVLHTQGVPGSHWGIPGGLGGAPSGRSSVPTAMDGSDAVSRRGKRVNGTLALDTAFIILHGTRKVQWRYMSGVATPHDAFR